MIFSLFWDIVLIAPQANPLGAVPCPKHQLYDKFKLLFNHKTDFRFYGAVG